DLCPPGRLFAAMVRARVPMVRVGVPRGTGACTNGSRRCPTWDRPVYQWFAPVSHAGRAHVPMVRVRVPRGTGACTNGSRPPPTWDGRSSRWFYNRRVTASPTDALSSDSIRRAQTVINPVFLRSPFYRAENMSAALGCNVVLKIETLNPIRCFKGRGADYFMSG